MQLDSKKCYMCESDTNGFCRIKITVTNDNVAENCEYFKLKEAFCISETSVNIQKIEEQQLIKLKESFLKDDVNNIPINSIVHICFVLLSQKLMKNFNNLTFDAAMEITSELCDKKIKEVFEAFGLADFVDICKVKESFKKCGCRNIK